MTSFEHGHEYDSDNYQYPAYSQPYIEGRVGYHGKYEQGHDGWGHAQEVAHADCWRVDDWREDLHYHEAALEGSWDTEFTYEHKDRA